MGTARSERFEQQGSADPAVRARLVEERRAILEQLRGYEIVVTGLKMRARQIERLLDQEPMGGPEQKR